MSQRPLRVLFDSEIFGLQIHGGISRYYSELMAHLPQCGILPRLFAPITFNHYLRTGKTAGFVGVSGLGSASNRYSRRIAREILRLSDQAASRMSTYDILHHTYYGRELSTRQPQVRTVVDMTPELFPDLFPYGNPHRGKREACMRASLLFAISEQTKRDLLRLYPELRCPVEVVHLAVDVDFFRARARGDDDGTLLFVGAREDYKDFSTFAQATAQLLSERPELRVLCVGGGPLCLEEIEPFTAHGVADRVAQRTVSDEELPKVYRRARAFVFPSLYEGFGLPILEAFASRCPVVLSNASCFPEVAADAAEYFQAGSSDGLLEALRRIVGDRHRRDELRELGEKRVGCFSWKRTAEQTASAYRQLKEAEA